MVDSVRQLLGAIPSLSPVEMVLLATLTIVWLVINWPIVVAITAAIRHSE